MSTVGEKLRDARESQGLSLRELAELTKIRADHLDALERGDYDPFPAPVYIKGSVRTYASILRMNTQSLLSELDNELAQSAEHGSPPSLTGARRGPLDYLMYQFSKVNWRLLVLLGGAVLVLALGSLGWQAWRPRARPDPLGELGPGLYRPLREIEDTLPVPTNLPSRR